jgi:hypothetical protein
MEEKPDDEGMTAKVYRIGRDGEITAPGTAGTGGYYIIVMNGSLIHDGAELGPWSLVWVGPDDSAAMLKAGSRGLEAMTAIFPVRDDWMRTLGEDA